MRLLSYIASRLLLAPLMIWTIVTIVFVLLRAAGGDPVDAMLGPRASAVAKDAMREQMGLTGSLWDQYLAYIKQLVHFDLGKALTSGEPIVDIVKTHLLATAELVVFGLIIAFTVGLLAGALSASHPDSKWDLGGRLFGIVTYAIPSFWGGMIVQLIFAVQLRWFPVGTRFPVSLDPPKTLTGFYTIDSILGGNWQQFAASVHHLILPCVTMGLLLSGVFERIVRVNLRQSLRSDYVEAARARGIPEKRILFVHALRNALIPVVTLLGLTLASLLGGAVLTEVTFSWPGIGGRFYQAILDRDYLAVQGIIVFLSAIVVMASILIDVVNAVIDPRIRY